MLSTILLFYELNNHSHRLGCIIDGKGIKKDARLILTGKVCQCRDFGP